MGTCFSARRRADTRQDPTPGNPCICTCSDEKVADVPSNVKHICTCIQQRRRGVSAPGRRARGLRQIKAMPHNQRRSSSARHPRRPIPPRGDRTSGPRRRGALLAAFATRLALVRRWSPVPSYGSIGAQQCEPGCSSCVATTSDGSHRAPFSPRIDAGDPSGARHRTRLVEVLEARGPCCGRTRHPIEDQTL